MRSAAMKLRLTAAVLAFLAAGVAQAKVTNIADYKDTLSARTVEEPAETTCSEACGGYDLTTLICPEGQVLTDCPVEGCSYYHKCETDSGE